MYSAGDGEQLGEMEGDSLADGERLLLGLIEADSEALGE